MACFENLPREIILLILSYFNPAEEEKDLLSLCRVSPTLYALAQPMLYVSYNKGRFCPSCCDPHSSLHSRGPLMYFTRTLINRPDLAARLRRLMVSTWDWHPDSFDLWPDALEPEMMKTLLQGIQQLKVPSKARWLPEIIASFMSPLIALLISQAPNLECLHIILGQDRLKVLLLLLGPEDGFNPNPNCLANLRTLSIKDSSMSDDGITLRSIKPILRLPQLEHFSISNCIGDSDDDAPFEIEYNELNISVISFFESAISADCMHKLMEGFKYLRIFVYEASETLLAEQFEPLEVDEMLYPQRENLEVIRLRVATGQAILDYDDHLKYESFESFENLRHLDIEQGPFSPYVSLPLSLEHLTIRRCEYPVFDLVEKLVEHCEAPGSALTEVFMQPRAGFCGGLVGLERTLTSEALFNDNILRRATKRAFRRLSRMLKDVPLEFNIDCEIWDDYLTGVL